MTNDQKEKVVKVGLLETFAEIIDTLYGTPMGASGENHAPGQVPDPGETTGTSKYLREDGTWLEPVSIPLNDTGHSYVEIAGIKWATMNIGAESITDTGLYFQWGDTQGYTAAQVGSGEGQKYFGWADYKYGNGTSSPGATGMTKYNSTDGKTVLDSSDDAVTAAWGGSWRMPTREEFVALGAAGNSVWVEDYQGSGVSGLVWTDKTDSSKVLFFPATGYCKDGSVINVGSFGYCWSSSVYGFELQKSWDSIFYFIDLFGFSVDWMNNSNRYFGFPVRGVLDDSIQSPLHKVAVTGNYNDLNNKPTSMPASDVHEWAKASNKPSYNKSEVGLNNVDNTADADKNVNYANSAGDASTVGGYGIQVVTSMPASPDANTIYIVK